jgi:hypothetical protein
MSALIKPIQLTGTTGLVTIYQVPLNKKARIDLRACNIHGSQDGYADVYIDDPDVPANSGYRARNFYIPFQQVGSAPDLEYGLVLTENLKVQIRASGANTIAFSLTGVEDDE